MASHDGNVSDSSSLSSVLDDPPPKKRVKGGAGADKKKNSGGAAAPQQSSDEAEVKKLQSQLVKCGVRKIWAFELKRYGDDAKAKIRHLKGILRDIGMDGRFSESRAREIKERRELLADLEAVQEMDRNWGLHGSSGRPSRSLQHKKSLKEPSSDEEEEEEGADDAGMTEKKNGAKKNGSGDEGNENGGSDDDNDDAPKTWAKNRSAARRADFPFLGSGSESDSD